MHLFLTFWTPHNNLHSADAFASKTIFMLISHIILLNNFKLNRLFSHASDCICYFILNVIFSDLVECIMTYRNNFACNIISAGICCMNIGFKISFLSDLYRNIKPALFLSHGFAGSVSVGSHPALGLFTGILILSGFPSGPGLAESS